VFSARYGLGLSMKQSALRLLNDNIGTGECRVTRWLICLRHWPASWKVAGSILDVIGIFD
jgi:hypothetical protein